MDFSAYQKARMRATQVNHMQDTCTIQTATQTSNSFGEEVETFVDGPEIECGLDMRPGSERRGQDNVITQYDATLRLNITRLPASIGRVKITKRYEEVLANPMVFEVVSPIQRGVSGIRILLRKIEL